MPVATLPEALTGTWDIDPVHSNLGFSVRHAMVTTVRGSFRVFSGELSLDSANPAASRATVEIDASTISTANEQRDAHLTSPDFLDVATYPTISFTSTEVTGDVEDFTLRGDLTIRGVTVPVEIAGEFGGLSTDPYGNVRAGFEGTTTISRKDFGMTFNAALDTGGVLVGDKIKLTLDVAAVKRA